MSQTLSTMQVIPPAPPVQQPMPITIPAPLSYEFQVAEYLDEDGKISKVELQMKVNQHDQYGNISIHGTWNPVPRVQIPKPTPLK
jgi:hypothetical protein